MKEQIINFETAKLAKEKKFNTVCRYCYLHKGVSTKNYKSAAHKLKLICTPNVNRNWNNVASKTSAPTQSLLQKWLRDIHNIHVYVLPNFHFQKNLEGYIFILDKFNNGMHDGIDYEIIYSTYEKALEKGLFEGLKLIK